MTYRRRILQYNSDMSVLKRTLSIDTDVYSRVESASFELLRQGGCGAGEITLRDSNTERGTLAIGDWIAMDYDTGPFGRWYLGRIEDITETTPKGVTASLQGPSIQMTELFPGGYANQDPNAPPHRIAKSDYFLADPDHSFQTWDTASQPYEVAQLFYDRFIQPRTIASSPLIEAGSPPPGFESMVFRREESVHSIVRALATQSHGASWGITQDQVFFFLIKRTNTIATFQEGYDCEKFQRHTDLSLLFNSVEVTGDYIYNFDGTFNRFKWTWINFDSRAIYGERRIRVFLPWIRRNADAISFCERFLKTYSNPTQRYTVTVPLDLSANLPFNDGQSGMPRPWEGQVQLLDTNGTELMRSIFDRVHVEFNHQPLFTLTLGPEDPQFGQPSEPHRWELPTTNHEAVPNPSIVVSGGGTAPSGVSGGLSSLHQSVSSDQPSSEAPSSDVPSSDAPSSDAPSSDVPSSDAPSSDAPSSDLPSSDGPSSDAPSDAPTCVEAEGTDSNSSDGGIASNWTSLGSGGGQSIIPGGRSTETINITGFDFSGLPAGKTVVGITVTVNVECAGNVAEVSGGSIGIIRLGGGPSGAKSMSSPTALWGPAAQDRVHGNDSDVWGDTWDTDDFNDEDFRVTIFTQNVGGTTRTAFINSVTVRVCYEE